MKPASLVLVVLALAVAVGWPLSSAIGAASASAFERLALRSAACVPEQAAAVPQDAAQDDGEDDVAAALPPGHPPVGALPPGHPPIPADGLPPGHPPIGRGLPPGHPPVPSGHGPALPAPGDLFGQPVLLTI